jgi:hypothetical protein
MRLTSPSLWAFTAHQRSSKVVQIPLQLKLRVRRHPVRQHRPLVMPQPQQMRHPLYVFCRPRSTDLPQLLDFIANIVLDPLRRRLKLLRLAPPARPLVARVRQIRRCSQKIPVWRSTCQVGALLLGLSVLYWAHSFSRTFLGFWTFLQSFVAVGQLIPLVTMVSVLLDSQSL